MAFDKLRDRLVGEGYYYSALNPKNWHRHINGGGWVNNQATVSNTVFVETSAIVLGGTIAHNVAILDEAIISNSPTILDTVHICENARIMGSCSIKGNSVVGGCAQIFDSAKLINSVVTDRAHVCGNAELHNCRRICGDIVITGGIWEIKSPLHFTGSRFSVTNHQPGYIRIGCTTGSFSWWKKNGRRLAKEFNLTKEEIIEYKTYIKLITQIGK